MDYHKLKEIGFKMKVYVASGWFSPEADEELTQIREIILKNNYEAFVPRDFFICPPDASADVQLATYEGNLEHLETSNFMLCNTRAKDVGTIFEAGYFAKLGKPIVYFCAGLPKGAKFNLMLSRSGVKVCTSLEELDDYLTRCQEAGKLLVEMYDGNIE